VHYRSNKKDNLPVFNSLVRDLKDPLVVIARQAELNKTIKSSSSSEFDAIQKTAEQTLRLLDSYLLISRSEHGQVQLPMEPVGVGSVIYDMVQEMRPLAKKDNVEVGFEISDANVMTNPDGLKTAVWCLSQIAISQCSKEPHKPSFVDIKARRFKDYVRVAIFGSDMKLKSEYLPRAKARQGQAHQAMSITSSDSGIRLAIADSICESLGTKLMAVKGKDRNGIGFNLLKSRQMELV